MARSDRLFELIQLLRRASRPITAQSLAQRLEVAVRTVYRDIAVLQSMRVPIDGEVGIGYIMRPGFDLPPLMFDADEVEAITVGLALLSRTGDRGLIKAAQRVASKLADVVPEGLSRRFADDALQVSEYGVQLPGQTDVSPFRKAVRAGQKLAIRYADENGSRTKRTVLPFAIFYYVEVAILVAWCELRNDCRHFRIDRIEDWNVLDGAFARRAAELRRDWMQSRFSRTSR